MGWQMHSLGAQTPFDEEFSQQAAGLREELQVFTDRSLYAVDELIYFVAEHRVSGLSGANPWSSVLYVELLASNGEVLVQAKYRIEDGRAEGTVHIPSESLTGSYFLKCYTRWMRNAGPESFSYMPLRIINPFRPEVIGEGNAGTAQGSAGRISYREGMLECLPASDSYLAGQEVQLQIQALAATEGQEYRACVSVVPEGSIDLEKGQYVASSSGYEESFRVNMLPDLGDHISVSGTVVGPDQQPVPYTTLHFSLLGEDPDYFAALSDADGRFVISTPTGEGEFKEFFVTPEQDNGSNLEVRIDQEYDSRSAGPHADAFQLNEQERELARKIALNMQLSKVFNDAYPGAAAAQEARSFSEGDRIPFYGTHVKRLLIDDYVMLPNLEEVFINLVPEVQFYRKQGRERIRILSDNSSIGIYNPLIMIDHISVFDHEALLGLSPEKIQRIDLITDIYLKGSVAFGGVLAIHSRKGDMAGIDLPHGSYFFDYQAFHSEYPRVDPMPVLEEREPDTRNTLLWSSALLLQKDRRVDISLKAPTAPGTYVVLVRAMAPDGQVISGSAKFSVK